jgi:cytochrome c
MSRAMKSTGSLRLRMALATLGAIVIVPAAAAQGDAARGAEVYASRCGGCHSVDADRVGPRHAGVFGRRAGTVEGFDYSPALKTSAVVWDAKSLDRWLTDPESLVVGQRMGYSLGDAALRADVIAYLATLTSK